MIEIYSFEEWDALQDPEKTIEWGSAIPEDITESNYNSCPYKDASLHIRRMFYSEYVHKATAPKK